MCRNHSTAGESSTCRARGRRQVNAQPRKHKYRSLVSRTLNSVSFFLIKLRLICLTSKCNPKSHLLSTSRVSFASQFWLFLRQADDLIIAIALYESGLVSKENLIREIGIACGKFGFFQLVNHRISETLQQAVIRQSEDFFKLSLETKEKYNRGEFHFLSPYQVVQPKIADLVQDNDGYNRGYERLRAQSFNKKANGDLKEGYYLGENLPSDDKYVLDKRFGQAPNKYPTEVQDPVAFQQTMEMYHAAMTKLAIDILRVIACTLNLEEDHFESFCEHPVATLRLLHYPPQDPATSDKEQGRHIQFPTCNIII